MMIKRHNDFETFLETNDEMDRFFKFEVDHNEDEDSRWKYHLTLFFDDNSSFDLYGKKDITELRDFINEMIKKMWQKLKGGLINVRYY